MNRLDLGTVHTPSGDSRVIWNGEELVTYEAVSPEDAALHRAKAVDLVTFPEGVTGAACANCQYLRAAEGETKEGWCAHKEVRQEIQDVESMCCSRWDAPGTKRAWEMK